MADRKIIDESHVITEKRGNGQLRREVWVDAKDNISRYNLAYIHHRIFQHDNGRVVGYVNAHDGHHRHYLGLVEPIKFTSFEDVEESFERDWTALQERK